MFLISRVASLLETPVADGTDDDQQLDVTLGGTRYTVKAGRQQLLNLFVSTFENAVEQFFGKQIKQILRLLEEDSDCELGIRHDRQPHESNDCSSHQLLIAAPLMSRRQYFRLRRKPCRSGGTGFIYSAAINKRERSVRTSLALTRDYSR